MLARENVKHNVLKGHLPQQALKQVTFVKADVLSQLSYPQELSTDHSEWDIVISNPPYISEAGFNKDTSRSVRNWEPKLALVPPTDQGAYLKNVQSEDIFYHRILDTARATNARILLMEVGDLQQALRVSRMTLDMKHWSLVEIWKDWPDQQLDFPKKVEEAAVGHHRIRIRGSGQGRSVLCRR
jgi:methylase of polypeptide subunit release factors